MIKIIGITDAAYAKYFTDANPSATTKTEKINLLIADLKAKNLM